MLPLRRATRDRILKGGTGDYAIAWKHPSISPTIPRPFLHWLGGNAIPIQKPICPHPKPIQNALGWAVWEL